MTSSCSIPDLYVSGLPQAHMLRLLLPLALTNFWTSVANRGLHRRYRRTGTQSADGHDGQISLGHAGFMAAGAVHGSGPDHASLSAPIGVTLFAAAVVGAILGVLVGLPALRLKGLYLAVSTLAAYFVIIVGLTQYQSAISYGSGFSIPAPSIFGITIALRASLGIFSPADWRLVSCCSI